MDARYSPSHCWIWNKVINGTKIDFKRTRLGLSCLLVYKKTFGHRLGSFLIHSSGTAHAAAPAGPTKMSPEAKPVEHDESFWADPSYDDKPYSSNQQTFMGPKNQSRSSIHYWNCFARIQRRSIEIWWPPLGRKIYFPGFKRVRWLENRCRLQWQRCGGNRSGCNAAKPRHRL